MTALDGRRCITLLNHFGQVRNAAGLTKWLNLTIRAIGLGLLQRNVMVGKQPTRLGETRDYEG